MWASMKSPWALWPLAISWISSFYQNCYFCRFYRLKAQVLHTSGPSCSQNATPKTQIAKPLTYILASFAEGAAHVHIVESCVLVMSAGFTPNFTTVWHTRIHTLTWNVHKNVMMYNWLKELRGHPPHTHTLLYMFQQQHLETYQDI